MIREQLETMNAQELRTVIEEAKKLLKRKKLYIRELGKPAADGHYIYLYATWQENGKTRQKSLGRKLERREDATPAPANEFSGYGVTEESGIAFLREMIAEGYFLAN